jgi:transposase
MALVRWVGRAIGLDVHRDFCVVAICEDGKVRSAGRVPSRPDGLRSLAESLPAPDRVLLEVTASCCEVARILEPYVDRVIVVSPDDTGIASGRAKTDKLDARALAVLCWKGEIDAVWMPDERCRILRRRLARREQLVHARSRSKNEISAVLARRPIERPGFADLFGVTGRRWLAEVQLPVEERESVDAGLRQIAFLDSEIKAVEQLIAQQALAWPEIRRLMTVPGVNLVCAATFIAAIGQAARFLPHRRLVAYLGLDPKVRQSGEAPARSGPISKRGSASARWALVEAAWSVVKQPGPLRAFYERVRARRGHGRAIVATARKLAILFWCMLKRGEDYAHQRQAGRQRLEPRLATADSAVDLCRSDPQPTVPSGDAAAAQVLQDPRAHLTSASGEMFSEVRDESLDRVRRAWAALAGVPASSFSCGAARVLV